MSYPDLVREFVHGAMAKHAAELAEAAKDPHVKALLDLGYRFQTEVIMPERIDKEGATVRIEAKLVPPPTDRKPRTADDHCSPVRRFDGMWDIGTCELATFDHDSAAVAIEVHNRRLAARNAEVDAQIGQAEVPPMRVWVLAYRSERDEHDNGVLGVYATEALARAAGIEEAGKDPNIAGRPVKWDGEHLFYQHKDGWYEVRPDHYVQAWNVDGA